MSKEKECEGKCPYCGSEYFEYISCSNHGDYEEEAYECDGCDREFIQTYSISRYYDYTEYEEIPLDKKTLFDRS